jgi:hypothetical protein
MKTATVTMNFEVCETSVMLIKTTVAGVDGLSRVFFYDSCNALETKLAASAIEKIVFLLPEINPNLNNTSQIDISLELKEMIRKFQAVAEDLEIPFQTL